jgi:hypothetical protein
VRYAEHGTFADANDCTRFEQMLPLLHELADLAEVSAERGACQRSLKTGQLRSLQNRPL